MSKQQKMNEIKQYLNPRSSVIICISVKGYAKGEKPQPDDLFSVDGKTLTLREIEEIPSNVKMILITVYRTGNPDLLK